MDNQNIPGWERKVERGNKLEISRNAGYAKRHRSVGARGGVAANVAGILEMIDTYDRPLNKFATKKKYKIVKAYVEGLEDESGKRLPKAELSYAVGVGHARIEESIFELEAKGPNAAIGFKASVLSAEAFATAELASASASAGPVKAKVAIAADTSASIGITGLEAKVLGTGISFGRKTGFSFLGSEISFSLW